jgi:SAM-dependent methyltransferase
MKSKDKEFLNCTCPLCGDTDTQVIRTFRRSDVLSHLGIAPDNPNYKIIILKIESIWKQDTAYFLECNNCLFQFAFPFNSGDSEFYSLVYDRNTIYPEWKWDYEISYNTIATLIEDNQKPKLTLLEVGAGNGSFVKRVTASLLLPQNILTTEFSDFGKSKINSLGIECLSTNLTDMPTDKYENYFDFICIFQVLEHLNNLDDVFKILYKLMKPQGHLFIAVPNNFHRVQFEKFNIIEDVPPVHIGRYNRKSFDFAGQKYGLTLVKHLIEPNNYLENVLKLIFKKYKDLNYLNAIKNLKIKRKILRRFLLFFAITPLIIINITRIFTFSNNALGISQWVHFKK